MLFPLKDFLFTVPALRWAHNLHIQGQSVFPSIQIDFEECAPECPYEFELRMAFYALSSLANNERAPIHDRFDARLYQHWIARLDNDQTFVFERDIHNPEYQRLVALILSGLQTCEHYGDMNEFRYLFH